MKIHRVVVNHRKAQLELVLRSGKVFPFPFAKLQPRPSAKDRVREAYVDQELGNEPVTYVLASGAEGSVVNLALPGMNHSVPDAGELPGCGSDMV